MASLSPMKLFRSGRDDNLKSKISTALREIDFHLKELDHLKARLAARRQMLFDVTVKALDENDRSKAAVYATEHSELRKVTKVVESSQLALMQVTLRLQSMTDIGDAMVHMNRAFKTMKQISKTVQGMVPALDTASQEINNTFTETMAEMGHLTPSLSLDVRTDSSDELIEEAKKFAEQQAEDLKRDLQIAPSRFQRELDHADSAAPLLASGGDEGEHEGTGPLGVMYSSPRDAKVETEVFRYALDHKGAVDVTVASSALGIPADEVEHSMLKLIAEGKVRLTKPGEK